MLGVPGCLNFARLLVAILLFALSGSLSCAVKAAHVSGSVKNSSGDPVANIRVFFENGSPDRSSATTDSQGLFSFETPQGDLMVHLDGPSVNALGLLAPPRRFLQVSGDTNLTFIVRPPDATLSGYVRDETGAGVSDVIVLVGDLDHYMNHFQTVSDPTGFYKFNLGAGRWGLEPDYDNLRSQNLQHQQFPGKTLIAGENATHDLRVVRMRHSAKITLVDEAGAPVQGLQVWGWGYAGELEFSPVGNFTGNVALVSMATGSCVLNVTAPDLVVFPQRFHVTNSFEATLIARPAPPKATMEGKLIDEAGHALAGVPITPWWRSTGDDIQQTTGAEGEFSFSGPAGECALRVADWTHLAPVVHLQTAPGSVARKIIRARAITTSIDVRVLDHRGEDAVVYADARTRVGADEFRMETYRHGVWTVPVFDGDWTIRIQAGAIGGVVFLKKLVKVSGDPQVVVFNLPERAPNGLVSGKIIDASGAGVSTHVTMTHEFSMPETDHAQDGTFMIGAFPGDWQCSFIMAPLPTTEVPAPHSTLIEVDFPGPITVIANQMVDLGVFQLPAQTARLTVRLIDDQGAPLNVDNPYLNDWVLGVSATHENATARYRALKSNDTNSFVLELFPGRWTFHMNDVELNKYGYAGVGHFSIDLAPGKNEWRVRIERLPSEPTPPSLKAFLGPDGRPRLNIFQKRCWPVDIESSTDLREWKFHANAFTNGEFMPAPNSNVFYRAVRLR